MKTNITDTSIADTTVDTKTTADTNGQSTWKTMPASILKVRKQGAGYGFFSGHYRIATYANKVYADAVLNMAHCIRGRMTDERYEETGAFRLGQMAVNAVESGIRSQLS